MYTSKEERGMRTQEMKEGTCERMQKGIYSRSERQEERERASDGAAALLKGRKHRKEGW